MKNGPVLAILGLAGLILGIGGGWGLHALLEEPVQVVVTEPEIIKQELTAEEIEAFCEDEVQTERQALTTAQDRVVDLQATLDAREAELRQLQKDAEGDAEKRAAAARKWKEMEAEIERLTADLGSAEQERDQLLVQLKETVEALDAQIKETEHQRKRAERYKDESQVNLWSSFQYESKTKICNRGTTRRHEKCYEAVDDAMAGVETRFLECVDTYQSTPMLVHAERSDRRADNLPPFAEWLSEDTRFTNKGWYIQFCDPTLPEASMGDDPD